MSKSGTYAKFVYNENGLRVQKVIQPSENDTTNAVVTNYTLHGKNIVHMTQGSNELHFFYDAQNKPAVVVYNGTPYTYVKNLQGDIVAILDSNGIAVVQYRYDAWGRQISCDVAAGNSNAAALSTLNPFRYRGYVYDEETELYYLRSRYYNPWWCRFVNADSLLDGNLFAYCTNHPTRSIDEDGYARSDVYPVTIDGVSGVISRSETKPIPELIIDEYVEWPTLKEVQTSGKVHVQINYLDFCTDQQTTMISSSDLYTISRYIGHEIERRYGIAYETIDIQQLKGEIALHMYGYIWAGVGQCYVIDVDVYSDGSVRDPRWYINLFSSWVDN